MKRYFQIFLMILIFSLFSCSNGVQGYYVDLSSSQRTVNINVSSENNSVNFSKSRTIVSDALYSSDLSFYLWGYDINNPSSLVDRREVVFNPTSDNVNEGYISLNMNAGYYRLYLAAVSKGQAYDASSILLYASSYVDLRYTEQEIRFRLTSKNLTLPGHLRLSVYTGGWNVDYTKMSTTAGLYKIDNADTLVMEKNPFTLYNGEVVSHYPNFYDDESVIIPAGTYNFVVNFIVAGGYVYQYSDKIIISPNQTTEADVVIPNIIGRVPSAPKHFIAAYGEPNLINSEVYPVEFCWTDTSNNESNFELQLLDLSKVTYPAAETDIQKYYDFTAGVSNYSVTELNDLWSTICIYAGRDAECYTNAYYEDSIIWSLTDADGSLTKNSSYCVFNMPLGHRYIARLRACNDYGYSDYVYCDIKNTGSISLVPTNTYDSTYFKSWQDDTNGLNIYRIIYNLNYGNFYDLSSREKVTSLVRTVFYNYQKKDAGYAFMNPTAVSYTKVGGETGTAILKYDSFNGDDWQYWSKDFVSLDLADAIDISEDYDGFKNVSLYANYTEKSESSDPLISGTWSESATEDIFVFYNSENSSALDPSRKVSVSKDSFVFSRNTADYLVIAVRNNSRFGKVTVDVAPQGGRVIYSSLGSTFNLYFSNYNVYVLPIYSETKFGNDTIYNIFINGYLSDNSSSYQFACVQFQVED